MERSLYIGIIQPSSPPERELLEKGLEVLRKKGIPFKSLVDLEESPPSHKAFLLYEALTCGKFTHLWAVRGGAGAWKLLPYLDDLFKESYVKQPYLPQLIGFSDITILHAFFWQKFGKKGLHAPMIVHLPNLVGEAKELLWKVLHQSCKEVKLSGRAYQEGEASGYLLGGNLSLVASLCGTPYFPLKQELILFLEDIGEKPYRLERAFLQILFSLPKGLLKGIVIGDLGDMEASKLLTSLREFLPSEIPIAYAFPFGHIPNNCPLLFGAKAKLKVRGEEAILNFPLD